MAVQATLAWEEKGSHPRAQRGPVAGADTKFSLAPSIGVFGFAPVRARSIFSSSFVVGPCASPPRGVHGCPCARPLEAATGRFVFVVVGRPMCKPPERGARAPVCKAARGGHRQVQGCARRALVRRGLWWPGACGVLAAGARARCAACAGCVPRSREAAGRAVTQSK